MLNFACGISTAAVGGVFLLISALLGYVFVPEIINNVIIDQVALIDDTIQLERFEEVPFPLNFTVRLWNVSNPAEVAAGGIPELNEVGPYLYKVYQRRVVEKVEADKLTYRIILNFEFDAERSFPYTEDDIVTIANVPYHAILQVASDMFENLMPILNLGLDGIFGAYNSLFMEVKVRDLLFDGVSICASPGVIGGVACTQVRALSADAQNLVEQEDGSLTFTLLSYRNNQKSPRYVVHRGLEDPNDLAHIVSFADHPHLLNWVDGDAGRGSGLCNMINGTDSGIFAPFVDRKSSIYALNTDICRSVELRHQYDTVYEGIPVVRFSSNEWFLDNHQGCFCLNVTRGINRPDGCLLEGTSELYSCVGAYLILSYPHFLYADPVYRNGVIGMSPVEEDHRIFLDIEPNTGTVIRGQKRAQFNIFMRPISGIPQTQNLTTTLVPIVWIEEGMQLPEEFAEEVRTRLLLPLTIVEIAFPVLIALSSAIFVFGVGVAIWAKCQNPAKPSPTPVTILPPPNSQLR